MFSRTRGRRAASSAALQPRPANFADTEHWIEVARILEEGGFDFLFFADGYGFPAINGDLPDLAAKSGPIVLGVSEVDRASDVDVVQDVQNQQWSSPPWAARARPRPATRG